VPFDTLSDVAVSLNVVCVNVAMYVSSDVTEMVLGLSVTASCHRENTYDADDTPPFTPVAVKTAVDPNKYVPPPEVRHAEDPPLLAV
jgi:hypothetical protein